MIKFLVTILLAALSAFVLTASAAKPPTDELEVRSGDTVVRISSKPCTSKIVIEMLKPEVVKQFRQAELRNVGKPTKGCWTMDSTGVFIILENGDQGYIPPESFKPVQTI